MVRGVWYAEEQNELASCHLWICFAVILGFARSSNDVQVKRTWIFAYHIKTHFHHAVSCRLKYGVASLDRSIAHVAFGLWNILYFRIKATPRYFRGSFILNKWKIPVGQLLLLKSCKREVNACCNCYSWFVFSQNDA